MKWRYTDKGVRCTDFYLHEGEVRVWAEPRRPALFRDATEAEVLALRLDGMIRPA